MIWAYFQNKQLATNEPEWMTAISTGRIYTLLGSEYAKLGQLDRCEKYLLEAMDLFGMTYCFLPALLVLIIASHINQHTLYCTPVSGKPFPTSRYSILLTLFRKILKRNIRMFVFNEMVQECAEKYQTDYANYLSECLLYLSQHFRVSVNTEVWLTQSEIRLFAMDNNVLTDSS